MSMIASGAEGLVAPATTGRADKSQANEGAAPQVTDNLRNNKAQAQQSSAQLGNQQGRPYQSNSTDDMQQPLEREQLEKVAQQLQDFMGEMNRSLQFQVDEESGRDVIKVLDKATGDVIKQYPSEEVLNMVSKLSETAGLLIDQTA